MDIVHHTLIGGTGFIALSAVDQELAGMAFVAGSIFPDLDVVFMAFGKRFYLRYHQGPSHSLLLSPLYALIIISPVLASPGFAWPVYIAALLGLWLHVMLDFTNTFGITLFWPTWPVRRCLDAVFFIDTVSWCLTIVFYIQAFYFPNPAAIYIYAGLLVLYLIFKTLLQTKVKKNLKCRYAIPASFSPFTFFILSLDKTEAKAYIYNAWSRKKSDEKSYQIVSQKYLDMAEKSEVFRDIRHITRHFFITDVIENEDEITIIAHDIGVRNFGGHFGKTILRFNINGDLIDEMAHI